MYLVDTNIWLERLLEQERADEVARFLSSVAASDLAITDFAVHSIDVILLRLGRPDDLIRFSNDLLDANGVSLVSLPPGDTGKITSAAKTCRLDFDDAYQFVAAQEYRLQLVSFDAAFDRTPAGRKVPADLIAP